MTDPIGGSAPEEAESGDYEIQPGRSLWGNAVHDLIRNPLFIIPSLAVLTVVSMAIFPQLWTSVDPHNCEIIHSKQGPTEGHPFGFTVYGCDMYAQVIYGARPDLIIAVVCTIGTTVLGLFFGTMAAYFGGWVDVLVSRLADVFFGLPFILAGLLILGLLDSHSVWAISGLLIAFGWPQLTRIVRGSVYEAKNRDYIEATRILGASTPRIIFRHILPNSIQPAIVMATLALGQFISAEATLTFLGVGLQRPTISWGVLISTGQNWAVSGHPYLLVFPCAFLIATVLAFILLGDAIRDAIDPKLN